MSANPQEKNNSLSDESKGLARSTKYILIYLAIALLASTFSYITVIGLNTLNNTVIDAKAVALIVFGIIMVIGVVRAYIEYDFKIIRVSE